MLPNLISSQTSLGQIILTVVGQISFIRSFSQKIFSDVKLFDS